MKEKSVKKKIALFAGMFVAIIFLSAALVSAQQPQPRPEPNPQPQPRPPMDPFGDAMFPPEMIMQHTRDLNLTDEQKTFMRAEINRTTTRFNELQWQLQDAMEALHTSVKENTVNEQQALAQLDKVLDTEREIKRLHFGLAISIKNKLTAEQQAKLRGMMQMHGPDGVPGRGPGVPGGPGGGPRRGPGGPPPGQRPEGIFEPMN